MSIFTMSQQGLVAFLVAAEIVQGQAEPALLQLPAALDHALVDCHRLQQLEHHLFARQGFDGAARERLRIHVDEPRQRPSRLRTSSRWKACFMTRAVASASSATCASPGLPALRSSSS